MAIWQLKRKDSNAALELHRQYVWSDEYSWTPLAQSEPVYTLSGAQDIQQGTMLAGRPITLDSTHARITRGMVKTLQAWSGVAELEMVLTHPDGRSFDVVFSRPAVTDIKPIKPIRPSDESDTDEHTANVHLFTV